MCTKEGPIGLLVDLRSKGEISFFVYKFLHSVVWIILPVLFGTHCLFLRSTIAELAEH